MRNVQEVEDICNLRSVIIHDLKEFGIKLPKNKKGKKEDSPDIGESNVFGNHLTQVPCLLLDDCGPVPRFLVEATSVLDEHINTEGLFRKSGSVARQKELKERIELGEELKDAMPLDVAGLIKQFFRELPDPLLTHKHHDAFLKCYNLETDSQRVEASLYLCLLLPWHHLSTLRFMMQFLSKVASHCENNKMDVQNLAVCLAPNLLHSNTKMEKIGSESRLLQLQTNVVQLLICHSDDIGMVSESLYGRSSLLSCFPSEDELEKSIDGLDDSKPNKKKKKRSGSLQGLVNNLSSSFSKWRGGSKHNSSSVSDKSSMLSIMSDYPCDASVMSNDSADTVDNAHHIMSDATPKVMRKRKASGEMIPFSASKKKAILQQMPRMATLGTPFTPVPKNRARNHDFQDTPNIRFADGSTNMVFNACTPNPTPRKNIDKLLSPSSATKVKRHTAAKGGCFSPKTPKTKRRSVKGFFRRLSGGKDSQATPGVEMGIGQRLAGPPDAPIIMAPGSSKRRSFFRRHKKTPSSPGRLLTPLRSNSSMGSQGSISSADTSTTSSQLSKDSITNLELAAKLQEEQKAEDGSSPVVMRPHRRGFSADGGALRRGRPNTVTSGLPAERYVPSPNRSRHSVDNGPPPRHSSQRDIFESPEKIPAGVIDTSPIPMAEPLVHDLSPVSMLPLDDDDDDDDDDEAMGDEPSISSSNMSPSRDMSILSRQVSGSSVNMEESMAATEEGLDQAFIDQEMSICNENHNESKVVEAMNKSSEREEVFKKPMGLPVMAAKKKEVQENTSESEKDKMNSSVTSDASNTSIITVIYNGQPVASHNPIAPTPFVKPPIPPKVLPKPDARAKHVKEPRKPVSPASSVDSIDSAIDAGAGIEGKKTITKHDSRHSLKSCDSGLGAETEMEGVDSKSSSKKHLHQHEEHQCFRSEAKLSLKQNGLAEVKQRSVFPKVTRHQSFLKETANPVVLKKRSNAERRRSAEPRLQVSAEMHHMLSRAGVVSEKARTPFTTMIEEPANESIANLKEKNAGKVAENICRFDIPTLTPAEPATQHNHKEPAERHTSPLRFANTVSRKTGASPVRIPTIFAKADKEAVKYREIARVAMRSPKPVVLNRAKLPITTNLLRSAAVESAKQRISPHVSNENQIQEFATPTGNHLPKDESAGHTPMKHPTNDNPILQSIEINTSLLDTINDVCTPKSAHLAKQVEGLCMSPGKVPLKDSTNLDSGETDSHITPRIKPSMLMGQVTKASMLSKSLGGVTLVNRMGDTTPSKKYRSPVKPVKRLQGSPHSPCSPMSPSRRLGQKSPHKVRMNSGSKPPSPIPAHVQEWGF